jgi:hypothetical protein
MRNAGMQMTSLPVTFADREGNVIVPQTGMELTGY